jgi:hypothetical protein
VERQVDGNQGVISIERFTDKGERGSRFAIAMKGKKDFGSCSPEIIMELRGPVRDKLPG